MVHARFSEVYIHFALMYTEDHIFLVLPIKYLINEDGDMTTPFKLATGTKPSVSHLCLLFCPCVVRKATPHVDKKSLSMCHQAQKGFCHIFVGIPQHQKGYLVYVPITRKIISSYYVVFDESFSSALAYMSRPYPEAMDMRSSVTYTSCATYSRGETGEIIMFAKFEEWNLLYETCNDVESGDESDDHSIIPPQLIEEEMYAMDYGDESDDDPMSTMMLEDICYGSQSHSNVNMIEACYKIRDRIKQRQLE